MIDVKFFTQTGGDTIWQKIYSMKILGKRSEAPKKDLWKDRGLYVDDLGSHE